MAAIDAGAEDVVQDGDVFEVVTDHTDLTSVRKALEEAGVQIQSSEIRMRTTLRTPLEEGDAGTLMKLIDALEENDDVQAVHGNFDVDDAVWNGWPRRAEPPGRGRGRIRSARGLDRAWASNLVHRGAAAAPPHHRISDESVQPDVARRFRDAASRVVARGIEGDNGVAHLAARQKGIVSGEQAEICGLGRRAREGRVRRGQWCRLHLLTCSCSEWVRPPTRPRCSLPRSTGCSPMPAGSAPRGCTACSSGSCRRSTSRRSTAATAGASQRRREAGPPGGFTCLARSSGATASR